MPDADKSVLLVFIQADSGVDGASLLGEASHSTDLFSSLKDTLFSGIIRRAQFAIPPLSLMILGSVKVDGVRQEYCDLRFERFPADRHWDLVGISVQTGAVRPAFELAAALRHRGVKVVLGGPYVTLFAERCREHADVLVCGEADDLWREVLLDLRKDALRAEYRQETPPDLSLSRPVSKSILDIKSYFTTNVVQTTRGCPYSCDFCTVHVMNGHRLRHRPVKDVQREVEGFLKEDRRIFFFLDDTINADERYARELFKGLIPLGIRWVGQSTTALGENPALLEVFARSGCGALLVGIESIGDGSNHAHHKFHNPASRQVASIKAIREAGICVYGSFIYGLDGDTLDMPRRIEEFIEETGVDVPGINLLRPIPGTDLFTRLAGERRLLHDPVNHDAFRFSWGQEMLYRPKAVPIESFIPSYAGLTKRVFTVANALKRAAAAPTLRASVLSFNLLYVHLYGLSRRDLYRQLATLAGSGEG
ncbi:MAG: B12-binding domain-containing radical SAM protein [Pelodictyon luteolum]|uniref:B12-binding domain-containing radical SAM protein n=1 Tax=Pelodictyon luteolum TaxID=1100 RepID=A0A165LGF2_PELLU|nr:radical SAM protein [Pelodictyon luteolum]KZK74005.1 MAG: B12-binding domain-containing radical SAM protein [Pelodictyon luteolum]